MKKIIIFIFALFSILMLNISPVHATVFTSYPAIANIVIELDFDNYPETSYIYYSDGINAPIDNTMGMFLYNDTSRRYDFINYLFYLKNAFIAGSDEGFIVDIYLPKRRSINGDIYNLEWGMFSYNAFFENVPIHIDSVIGSEYIALKFIYYNLPAENREYFNMYLLDNIGRPYTSHVFGGLDYAMFNKNYGDAPTSDFNLFANLINYDASSYEQGYDLGYDDGYDVAKKEYGYYDGSNYISADDYGLDRYNNGLNENREYFGIDYNGNWLTAEQWGDIRHNEGYNEGLSGEIDWFSWSTTFFLMPFRILNIEILPGVRIGYFALFSLLIGVVGWFFFIVGKGGGRRK